MKTVTLDVRQWLICIAAALSIVVVTEIRKMALRAAGRRHTPPASTAERRSLNHR
jgi:hypothetical protein